MITLIQDIPDFNFSSSIPDLKFTTSDDNVGIYIYLHQGEEKKTIFNEWFRPDKEGVVELQKVNELLLPYLEGKLNQSFSYSISLDKEEVTKDFRVQHCDAEIDIPATVFLKNFFLSTMQGEKSILIDSPEFIHFYEEIEVPIIAHAIYDLNGNIVEEDITLGQSKSFEINTVEVSPHLIEKENHKLLEYTIQVDARKQRYVIDYQSIEARPRLLFTNSFGCQEVFICKGTLELEAKHTRSSGWINNRLRNYDVKEERTYKADTGYMTPATANWVEDLIRSPEVYLLEGRTPGKEIVITDSKINRSMGFNELPSFSFDYQLSQRNHNVLQFKEAGRIFDSTFDLTFN